MNWKSILIFIVGVVVGIVVSFCCRVEEPNNIIDNISSSTINQPNEKVDEDVNILEGEITGFEDSRTVEIVSELGPILCKVYDEELVKKLEGLLEQKIKVQIEYNEKTRERIIQKIL